MQVYNVGIYILVPFPEFRHTDSDDPKMGYSERKGGVDCK